MERKIASGEFYRHFKNKLYQVIAVAVHSETGERMVVYQALYGDYQIYVRPYEMFVSEVDHETYPDAAQKYRFERVYPEADKEAGGGADKESESFKRTGSEADLSAAKPNPELLAFLDAATYEEQMECLARLEKTAKQSELNSLYVALDMKAQDGSVAEQMDGIRRYLALQRRYDGVHLR